mmetsp:Transcript_9466/g.21658  ORF Transcript_9466/g.21658 Transcript_9466/m.21658 type:complete len:237 (-) Transcript_9466:20-730(-)
MINLKPLRPVVDREKCELLLRRKLKEDPNDLNTILNLGCVLEQGANFTGAKDSYRRALEIDPKNARALRCLAVILHFHQQNIHAAETIYNRILAENPEDVRTLCLLGQLRAEHHKDIRAAEAYFRKVLALDRSNPTALCLLGALREKQDDFKEAEDSYLLAMDWDPNLHNKADILLRLEQLAAKKAQAGKGGDIPRPSPGKGARRSIDLTADLNSNKAPGPRKSISEMSPDSNRNK